MQKVTMVGTVGKNITVSETDKSKRFEFFLNVKKEVTTKDGVINIITMGAKVVYLSTDVEFEKKLKPSVFVLVSGFAVPLLIERNEKTYPLLEIDFASVLILGGNTKNFAAFDAVGYIGSSLIKEVGEMAVCNFSVAENRLNKDTGESTVMWARCSFWKKADKTKVFDYLTPGQLLYVTGEPYIRVYTDKNGDNAVSLEVRVNNVELLGGGKKRDYSTRLEKNSEPGPELATSFNEDLPF
ncbi:MAG: single-stranded DNA-binding protein [Bacteroidales bacterium]